MSAVPRSVAKAAICGPASVPHLVEAPKYTNERAGLSTREVREWRPSARLGLHHGRDRRKGYQSSVVCSSVGGGGAATARDMRDFWCSSPR